MALVATGSFWKPVYYILEEAFTVLLVNPAHIKNVPGRKTDVLDAAWIASCWSTVFCGEDLSLPSPSGT